MKTKLIEIDSLKRAIVMFGPPTDFSGMRPAEYYQVTLDPNLSSPSGEFLRFDQTIQGGELHGWQRLACITICEILGDAEPYEYPNGCTVNSEYKLEMAMVDNG